MNEKWKKIVFFYKNGIYSAIFLIPYLLLISYFCNESRYLSLMLASGVYAALAMVMILQTKRLWLIPMALILPIALIPGEIASISIFPRLGNHAVQAMNSYPNGLHTPNLLFGSMAFSVSTLLIWCVYFLGKKDFTFRRGIIQFSTIILISLVFWCLMLGIHTLRALNTVRQAEKTGNLNLELRKDKTGKTVLAHLQQMEQVLNTVQKRHPGFQPPSCGTFSWLEYKNNEFSEAQDRIVNQTLSAQNSPEIQMLYQKMDALAEAHPYTGFLIFGKTSDMRMLNVLRELVRQRAGQAEIAHYTGMESQILPPLEQMELLNEMTTHSKLMIVDLFRCNVIERFLAEKVFTLGPVGPEYAPVYRRMLKKSLEKSFSIPDDIEFTTIGLQYLLRHIYKKSDDFCFSTLPDDSFPFALLMRPVLLNLGYSSVKDAIRIRSILPKLEHDVIYYSTSIRHSEEIAKHLAGSSRFSRGLSQTVFALKLYRSLYGQNPEELKDLCPSILQTLPNDPYTGKPFGYRRKDDVIFLETSRFSKPLSNIPAY